MHPRVTASRFINYYFLNGKKNEMISSRVYREHRYGWILCIDWWFYMLFGHKNHCRKAWLWERRENAKIPRALPEVRGD